MFNQILRRSRAPVPETLWFLRNMGSTEPKQSVLNRSAVQESLIKSEQFRTSIASNFFGHTIPHNHWMNCTGETCTPNACIRHQLVGTFGPPPKTTRIRTPLRSYGNARHYQLKIRLKHCNPSEIKLQMKKGHRIQIMGTQANDKLTAEYMIPFEFDINRITAGYNGRDLVVKAPRYVAAKKSGSVRKNTFSAENLTPISGRESDLTEYTGIKSF